MVRFKPALRPQSVIFTVLLCLFGLALNVIAAGSAQAAAPGADFVDAIPTLCLPVTAIPAEECGALVAIYTATDGPNWLNNARWLEIDDATSPCDWSGVTCVAGHVDALRLPRNGLRGDLPPAIRQLTSLRELDLAGNALGEFFPAAICDLRSVLRTVDVSYNQIGPRAARTRSCLDELDPGWSATQTIRPRTLEIDSFAADTVTLQWEPIAYGDDGGFYEIGYSTTFNGEYTVHGITADRTLGAYTVDGLAPGTSYFFQVVAVTPSHANHPAALRSEPAQTIGVTQGTARILLTVIISADNNLTSYVPGILRKIQRGTALNPNITALVLVDQRGPDNTRVARVEGGALTALDAVVDEWGALELDMADPAVISWFLRYAREAVAAERTIVSLVGHGVGPTPDLAWAPPTPPEEPPAAPIDGIPPLPRGLEFTPADVTDVSYLSTLDLAQALAAATDDGANPFDILFFDQCFQGNLDVLYEVRDAAKIFIASPNYAWLVAPYAQYISQMAPAATNEAIADAIMSRYQANLNNRHPNAIFWARSEDIGQVAAAVSELGEALLAALNDEQADLIRAAALDAAFVDTTQCGVGEYVLGPPDELMGAASFAQALRRRIPADDPYGLDAAAAQVIATLRNLSSSARTGSPYLAPDSLWDYNDRITILAPLLRNLPPSVVWRASVYQADAGTQAAVWTPDPTQTVLVQGNYAFVEDYQWDEFINAWYGELTPTIGNWCHYTPPAIVAAANAEALTLDVATSADGQVALAWTAPADADPDAYHLYMRRPEDIDLALIEALPAATTSFTVSAELPGDYMFRLVAVDAREQALADSGEVNIALEWADRLYLPIVTR